jgi:hypothetical protein
VTNPALTGRNRFVFDSIVVVPTAPSGGLWKAHTAPAVSAKAIRAPPCRTSPAVQRSDAHAIRARTSSFPASRTSIPSVSASGIIAPKVAGSGFAIGGQTLPRSIRRVAAELYRKVSLFDSGRGHHKRRPAAFRSR